MKTTYFRNPPYCSRTMNNIRIFFKTSDFLAGFRSHVALNTNDPLPTLTFDSARSRENGQLITLESNNNRFPQTNISIPARVPFKSHGLRVLLANKIKIKYIG